MSRRERDAFSRRSAAVAPPIRANPREQEQIQRLIDGLRQIDGVDPALIEVVRGPLRICPLGAHIDHQLGVVTGMTIDQSILMAFVPTEDGRVYVESLNFADAVDFRMDSVPSYQAGQWANYVRGAVRALQQEHEIGRGLIGVVGGTMPIGGLSSSAAITISYLLALESINGVSVTPDENVSLCRFTENRYIGLNNGILDQSVILYSERDHLTRIDCQSVTVDRIACPPVEEATTDFEIMSIYSGITHVLVGTDYNNRVAECQAAARQLLEMSGQPVPADARLRHVSPMVFADIGKQLAGPLQKRARHYFGEMQRVEDGVEAWAAGDIATVGELINQSGESSIKCYECGSPQLITLYEILRQTPGVYGTRFSGAGFRGNCIALIDPRQRESIADAVHQIYPLKHPSEAERYSIHFCRSDGPAGSVPLNGELGRPSSAWEV